MSEPSTQRQTMRQRHLWLNLIFGVVWLILALPLPVRAEKAPVANAASSHQGDDIAAIVDGFVITERTLKNRIISTFGDGFDSTSSLSMRSATLKSLIMEQVIERLISDKQIRENPGLANELIVLKRRALLKFYLEKNAPPPAKQITDRDVEKFLGEHPEFFNRRKTYHFGELIIKTQTAAIKQAVKDRLAHLAEYKDPTPESVQMVTEWLNQNNITYGYSNVWKASEQIDPDSFADIKMMDEEGGIKLSVKSASSAMKAVVLFNSYEDPLDPLFSKRDAFNRLTQVEHAKQHAAVMDDILLSARVTIPDNALARLILPERAVNARVVTPAHGVAPQEPIEAANAFYRVMVSWSFSVLLLAPTALSLFFLLQPPADDYGYKSALELMSYTPAFKSAVVMLAGVAILGPAVMIQYNAATMMGLRFLVLPAMLGLTAAAAAIVAITKTSALHAIFSARWMGMSALFAVNLVLLSANFITNV